MLAMLLWKKGERQLWRISKMVHYAVGITRRIFFSLSFSLNEA